MTLFRCDVLGGVLPSFPPIPWLASTWGLTRNRLYSTFQDTSQIDMAGTLDSSKMWFRKNAWTLSSVAQWSTCPDTPANQITCGASGLVLNSGTNSGIGGLSTAAETTPGSYIGLVQTGSFYCGFKLSFDQTTTLNGDTSWVIAWGIAVEALATPLVLQPFDEDDMAEFRPPNSGVVNGITTLREWANPSSSSNNAVSTNFLPAINGGVDANLHHYEYVRIVPADNGGTGKQRTYYDGTLVADTSYFTNAGSNPAANPGNPNGIFADADPLHRFFKIAAG